MKTERKLVDVAQRLREKVRETTLQEVIKDLEEIAKQQYCAPLERYIERLKNESKDQ